MPMKIVLSGGTAEIVIKKSRFIADVRPVSSAEEAYAYLAEIKKRYWDASHSCHAFVIGENNQIAHSSDDGEPQGTAGKPILQVLTGRKVHGCIIVVTRYFGGVLLGTGGLVRAYTEAAKAGLENSLIADKKEGLLIRIRSDYEMIGKIQYLIGVSSLPVTDTSYTDVCETEVLVPASAAASFKSDVTEKTAGKAQFIEEEIVEFVQTEDGKIQDIIGK